MNPGQPSHAPLRSLAPGSALALGALGAAAVALSVKLWPQWQSNPDLSHGYFMPFLYVFLLYECHSGTPRFVRSGPAGSLALAALLAGALLALTAAGLFAAAVDWSHALVNLMLVLSLTCFTGATVLVLAGATVRFFSLNWPAVVAATLWLLTTPIPPGTYQRLTLTLQLWISEGVLRTLHLLGIAAIRHGNVIDLATTSVGVEEACSGVRSLISCVFAGLFFSATLVRQPWARGLIIFLSAPLALGMNFLRSLLLTILAHNHVDIAGTWHDLTGFAVLGITAAILGGLALALERTDRAAPPPALLPSAPPRQATVAQWIVVAGFALAAAFTTFFVLNTRKSDRPDIPLPNLPGLLPDSTPGWLSRAPDLQEFRGILRTEHLAQREYVRPANDAQPVTEIVIYVAYWRPGQAPVSLVASHTPDACWPGAGWNAVTPNPPAPALQGGGRQLSAVEYRVFESKGVPHHVWFWHLHDGRPITFQDPYSPVALLRLAWQYGFRRDGDQLFVRISSNRPWREIQAEPLLQDFFTRIKPFGL
jgi:exosortase